MRTNLVTDFFIIKTFVKFRKSELQTVTEFLQWPAFCHGDIITVLWVVDGRLELDSLSVVFPPLLKEVEQNTTKCSNKTEENMNLSVPVFVNNLTSPLEVIVNDLRTII